MIRSVVVSICVLTLAAFCPVNPQTQAIAKAEFEEITRRGYDNLAKHPHRITITDQRNDIREGDIISQTIEKESSVRWKNETIVKTDSGTRRDQRIRVDDKEFEKKGNEPWREPEKVANRFTVKGDRSNVTETEMFRSVGTEVIGGESLRIFESETTFVFRTADGTPTSHHVHRYWVDTDGRFKKEERKSTQNGRVFWHGISTYEYDSTIKIKLPIQPEKY